MSKAYVQTTPLTSKQQDKAIESASRQRELVKALFADRTAKFTPSQVHRKLRLERLIHPRVPITSIRRAMTLLSLNVKEPKKTPNAFLIKSNELMEGEFGKPEHVWVRYMPDEIKQPELF